MEVRFTLNKVYNPGTYDWRVAIQSAEGPSSNRTCSLARKTGTWSGNPYLQIQAGGSGQATQNLTVAIPTTYLLQSWGYLDLMSGKRNHTCRLLQGSGKTVLASATVTSKAGAVNKPGTVKVTTLNADITVDHVRAHDVQPH